MRRFNLLWLFIVTWLQAAMLELTAVFMVTYDTPRTTAQALMLPVYHAPVVAYLIAGSVILASIVTIWAYAAARRQRSALASRLAQLTTGHVDAPVLARQQVAADLLGPDNAQLLEQLRQKMIRLQREIERYANVPVRVAGESKEEILTAERHRLARELHDSVSQQLFAAMMMLSAVRSVMPKDDPQLKTVVTIEGVINEAQAEMRALLLHLRPTNLEGKSLKAGIIGLLQELQTKIHIKITWELDDVHLGSAIEDNLFRIVQELLSNTLRHAKADSLEVYLKAVGGNVILRVVDDGVGFDLNAEPHTGAYGLANIQERATSVGGTARVISFPNQGTTVEVRVPMPKDEPND